MVFLEIAAPPLAARDDNAQVLTAVRLYARFVIFWRTRVRPTDHTRFKMLFSGWSEILRYHRQSVPILNNGKVAYACNAP